MSAEVLHGTSNGRTREPGSPIDRTSLRLAATLLLTGQLLYIVVTQFHTGGDANNHPVIFADYASSELWKGVHVGQFVCAAILLAGLVALCYDVDVQAARARWASRFGAASAVVALALYGVLQAIDGVGNKQVDAAWVSAPASEKAARFASAESMRWLEWGLNSYHAYALGLALLVFAAAVMKAAGVPRALPSLMGLSGLAYLAQGWVAGSRGFDATHSTLIVASWVVSVAWMVWLLAITWRAPRHQTDAAGR